MSDHLRAAVRARFAAEREAYDAWTMQRMPEAAELVRVQAAEFAADIGALLTAPPVARALSALATADDAEARAVALVSLLRWSRDHRGLLARVHPREVAATRVQHVKQQHRAMANLQAVQRNAGPRVDDSLAEAAQRIATELPPHLWAEGLDLSEVARRGAGEPASAWRGLLVARIAELVPARASLIAALLRLTGDATADHRRVAAILTERVRR